MTARPDQGRWPAVLVLGAAIAACQPLPQPFAEDRPPAELLRIRDSAGVSIAPIEGQPEGVAAKLGSATAAALLKREIPASDKTTSLGSYLLYGRVFESPRPDGKSAVTALWRLYDAKGQEIGERRARLEAASADWASAQDGVIVRLATASADELAPLLADDSPAPGAAVAPGDARPRIALGKISGAPGDGAASLATAVAAALKRKQIAVVEGKADLAIEGEIAVAPVGRDRQHVKIVWRLRRADGTEIGTVGQENEIPRGLLDGPWGDVAYQVALAASDGLVQLVAGATAERVSPVAARQ